MAHSDIFLRGQSNDAMLTTRVYSVIKEKKGVVKSFSLSNSTFEKTSSYPWLVLHADAKPAKTNRLCSRPSSGGQKCIQLKPRMDNNWLSKTNTNLRGNSISSSLLLLSSHFTLFFFFTLWLHFSSRPGESHFPFSHMSIYKRRHHTEHTAGLFVGDFWSSLALSCTALTQLQKTMGF